MEKYKRAHIKGAEAVHQGISFLKAFMNQLIITRTNKRTADLFWNKCSEIANENPYKIETNISVCYLTLKRCSGMEKE